MKPKLNNRKWIAFKPELDTWLALASVLAMTGIYYFNTNYGFDIGRIRPRRKPCLTSMTKAFINLPLPL